MPEDLIEPDVIKHFDEKRKSKNLDELLKDEEDIIHSNPVIYRLVSLRYHEGGYKMSPFDPEAYRQITLLAHRLLRLTAEYQEGPFCFAKDWAVEEYESQLEKIFKSGDPRKFSDFLLNGINRAAPGLIDSIVSYSENRILPPATLWGIADVVIPTYITKHGSPSSSE